MALYSPSPQKSTSFDRVMSILFITSSLRDVDFWKVTNNSGKGRS